MREIWTATIEVLTTPTEAGDTRAFTNVVSWASSANEFCDAVTRVFEGYDWAVVGFQECRSVSSGQRIPQALADLIDRARDNPNACIYGTFHYYPSRPS
jgi:hypothetical protein